MASTSSTHNIPESCLATLDDDCFGWPRLLPKVRSLFKLCGIHSLYSKCIVKHSEDTFVEIRGTFLVSNDADAGTVTNGNKRQSKLHDDMITPSP